MQNEQLPWDPETPLIDGLWQQYKSSGGTDLRNRLILHYAPLVSFVAGRLDSVSPPACDRADLTSFGMFGLIDAIEKFEPARGFKFHTYAITRIRGAIIDELRSIDWAPRRVRARARAIDQMTAALEVELGRSPSRSELAERLGIDPAQLEVARLQAANARVWSLDAPLAGQDDEGDLPSTLAARIPDLGDPLGEHDMADTLTDAILHLSDRERLVIALYYYEHLSLAAIGGLLGVTESRVCQIHTRSLANLRRHLHDIGETAAS